MAQLRVALITTVRHNVGDDLVRDGIVHLLCRVRSIESLELIHKHAPVTAAYGFERVRSGRASRLLYPVLRHMGLHDRIDQADVVVQCGAPVYWCHPGGPHCADNEWFGPLLRSHFLKDRRDRKLLNVAAGSCQRHGSDGSEILACRRCTRYIDELFQAATLTSLRDRLAASMLRRVCGRAAVLPCTSIFSRDRHRVPPEKGEFIVLNFMEGGGHFTFGQDIDSLRWRRRFVQIAARARAMDRTVIACHSPAEAVLARRLLPDFERVQVARNAEACLKLYARARFGIVNRVHAGLALASLGKPAAVIGNDSRALTMHELGLDTWFVGEIDPDCVDRIFDALASRERRYADEAEAIRDAARVSYLEALSAAL